MSKYVPTGRPRGRPKKTQAVSDELDTQEPPIQTRGPGDAHEVLDKFRELSGDKRFWPSSKPLPGKYVRARARLPCPKCRRVMLDNMGQAVICRVIRDGIAYLTCRGCDHLWKMPVEE